MKNYEKKDKWLRKRFKDAHLEPHSVEREVRETRRLYKKLRNKLERRAGRNIEDSED